MGQASKKTTFRRKADQLSSTASALQKSMNAWKKLSTELQAKKVVFLKSISQLSTTSKRLMTQNQKWRHTAQELAAKKKKWQSKEATQEAQTKKLITQDAMALTKLLYKSRKGRARSRNKLLRRLRSSSR